jgi:YVTN family beta-propeller protein
LKTRDRKNNLADLIRCLTFLLCTVGSHGTWAAAKSSVLALTPDNNQLLVINPDSNSVSILDVTSPELNKISEVSVGRFPQTLSIDAAGMNAYITNRSEDTIAVLDLSSHEIVGCIPVNDEPFGVVAGQGRIFVSNQGDATVSVINTATHEIIIDIQTDPNPRGLALSADESLLYVTHFLSGNISVIDTNSLEVETVISTGISANLSQTITLDGDNDRAYLPQTFSNVSNQALLFDTTVLPVVSILDTVAQSNLRSSRISLDVVDRPVGIPIDSAITSDGRLLVVNAASNDVSIIDVVDNSLLAHVETGHNPRGIFLDETNNIAYISNSLGGSISILDLSTYELMDEVPVTEIPLATSILNGKRLFNSSDNSSMALDQWIACATCHFEGELDGRTWFFPDGPRNTPSLLGLSQTLPMHWSGDLDEIHDVESTIRDIQAGEGLVVGDDNCDPACDQALPNQGRSSDLDDLALFMATLQFEPNPYRTNIDNLQEAIERGQDIFSDDLTACASCHIPPLYTDLLTHDVGTGAGPFEKKGNHFDTPSLRGIYKTAPYLHDGSAETLGDVLITANADDLHGIISHLSSQDLQDLQVFLKAIPQTANSEVTDISGLCGLESVNSDTLQVITNQSDYEAGDRFILSLVHRNQLVSDIYIAIIFPDNTFITLREGNNFRINEIIPYKKAVQETTAGEITVLDIQLPSELENGIYEVVTVMTGDNFDVMDRNNWTANDRVLFSVY